MMTKEAREAKGAFWLQHWRECAASGEGLAGYARRHGLDADEGYRWKRILRRAQRWPAAVEKSAAGVVSALVAMKSAGRFARVRIASPPHPELSLPLRLQLLLSNGRRAELLLGDEQQLPRVLTLLEQPG